MRREHAVLLTRRVGTRTSDRRSARACPHPAEQQECRDDRCGDREIDNDDTVDHEPRDQQRGSCNDEQDAENDHRESTFVTGTHGAVAELVGLRSTDRGQDGREGHSRASEAVRLTRSELLLVNVVVGLRITSAGSHGSRAVGRGRRGARKVLAAGQVPGELVVLGR